MIWGGSQTPYFASVSEDFCNILWDTRNPGRYLREALNGTYLVVKI